MGLFGSQPHQPTKLNSIRVTQSVLGTVIPIVMGQGRVPGRLIWYGDWQAIQQKQNVGGKGIGGGNVTSWVYQAAVQEVLCQGPIRGLINVWDSGGRFTSLQVTENYTVPGGGGNYTVSNQPNYNLDHGVGRADSYSVVVNDYGSPGPVTLSGTQQTPMTLVGSSPGAGQYTQSGGTYGFSGADAGKTMSINYSFSMYYIITGQTDSVPSSGPFQITVQNSANFYQDLGVVYYPSGNKLTAVGGAPSAGQYHYNGGGVYQFAAADAAQGILINYSYKDTSANQSYNHVLNATVFLGQPGQAVWGYLTSKHPDQALGYTQVAHLDSAPFFLGNGGETPNYNFEIAGLYQWGNGVVDAHPVDCITGFLTDTTFGLAPPIPNANLDNWKNGNSSAYNYWAAAGFFISPVIDNQQTMATILQQILDAGNVGMVWSEGLLKLKPYGDTSLIANGYQFTPPTTPVVDLNDDDFIVPEKQAQEPIQVARKDWQDAYNRVTVEYLDRLSGYNPQPVYEQDDASVGRFGLRNESPQSWHFITTLTSAQFAANIRLKRQAHIWNTYTFKLGWVYSYLEPMDLVTITDTRLGYSKLPIRITEIKDNPDGTLDITAEDFPWGTATATLYPKQAAAPFQPIASQMDPGDTSAIIFEATNRLSLQQGDTFYLFASGSNPNWGGCNVWASFDNTNYELVTTISNAGRTGILGTTLPSGSDPDNTNTLNVVMTPGAQLGSVTHGQADQFETLCAICNADGSNLELISYATATLTSSGSGNTYNLTYLRRGVYGTTIASHAAGSLFARLDQASYTDVFDPTYYGVTVYFKFTSFNTAGNREQQLANVTAIAFVISGANPGAIAATDGTFNPGLDKVPDGVVYAKQAQFTSSIEISNANFEASTSLDPYTNAPPGWLLNGTPLTVAYETGSPYSGTQSLKLSDHSNPAGYGVKSGTKFKVNQGEIYRVSAALKVSTAIAIIAECDLQFFDGNNTLLADSLTLASTTSWTYVTSGPTVVPAGAVYGQVFLWINNSLGTLQSAWFDNILVEKLLQGANVSYTPLTNPLTGHDAGSSATINIASFTMRLAGIQDIGDSSGSITSLSYGTLYYVYYDDPFFAGGAVGYQATTTKSTALNGYYRYYDGSIVTPVAGGSDTIGNGDGGAGAQTGTFYKFGFAYNGSTSATSSGVLSTSNASNLVDGDTSTYATVSGTQAGGASSDVVLQLFCAGASALAWKSLTLKVKYAVPTNSLNGASAIARLNIAYTTSYAPFPPVTFPTALVLVLKGTTAGVTIASASLPINTNFNVIGISISVVIDSSDGNGTALSVNLYEVWVEGQI